MSWTMALLFAVLAIPQPSELAESQESEETLQAVNAIQLYDKLPADIVAPEAQIVIWRAPDVLKVEETGPRLTIIEGPDGDHRIKADLIRQHPETKDIMQSTLWITVRLARGPPPEPENPEDTEPDPSKVRSVYLIEETSNRTAEFNQQILELRKTFPQSHPNVALFILDKDSPNIPDKVRQGGGDRAPPYVVLVGEGGDVIEVKDWPGSVGAVNSWLSINESLNRTKKSQERVAKILAGIQ